MCLFRCFAMLLPSGAIFLPLLKYIYKKNVLSSARLLYEFLCFDPKWLFSTMYLWLMWVNSFQIIPYDEINGMIASFIIYFISSGARTFSWYSCFSHVRFQNALFFSSYCKFVFFLYSMCTREKNTRLIFFRLFIFPHTPNALENFWNNFGKKNSIL